MEVNLPIAIEIDHAVMPDRKDKAYSDWAVRQAVKAQYNPFLCVIHSLCDYDR